MVTKIQPPSSGLRNAVTYNEKKMEDFDEKVMTPEEEDEYLQDGCSGHILVTRNVPEGTTFINELQRLRFKNIKSTGGRKLENTAFHMSVNPGENDKPMTEKQVIELIDEIMSSLGYKDNPYRVYRHNDTGRTHYHVVSTRIGQDGKKIKDSYENRRCEKITRDLADKYGFIYGLQEKSTKISHNTTKSDKVDTGAGDKEKRSRKEFIPPYSKNSSLSAIEQYRLFHNETMKWSFTTPEQYAAIMKYRFNTNVLLYQNGLNYSGINKDGTNATELVNESVLELFAASEVGEHCLNTDMKQKRAQRERLEKNLKEIADKSASWKEFKKNAATKGILIALSWNEQNELFGVTWMDRATRCAWKASQTHTNLEWLNDMAKEHGWKITRHPIYEKLPTKKPTVKTAQKDIRQFNTKSSASIFKSFGTGHRMPKVTDDAAKKKDWLTDESKDIII